MPRPLARDEEGLSTLWSLIGLLVLVAVILVGYFGYIVPKFPPPPDRVLVGDTVTVDYIGTFENGLVFDTSLASVGEDNASHPKAFTFSWRESWQPLTFAVGKEPPAVIRGFELGVQGLSVGDTRRISIPPDLGYGAADPTKVQVKNLTESVAVRLTMDEDSFRTTYGTEPVGGSSVTDPVWGWTVTVEVADTIVTVTNSPVPGSKVRPFGAWEALVVSITSGADGGAGRIEVQHLLDAESVDRVGRRIASGGVEFVITAVDTAAGTFTMNFDQDPPKGRVLVFQVTIVRIAPTF
jgi:hypothetical protein